MPLVVHQLPLAGTDKAQLAQLRQECDELKGKLKRSKAQCKLLKGEVEQHKVIRKLARPGGPLGAAGAAAAAAAPRQPPRAALAASVQASDTVQVPLSVRIVPVLCDLG